MFCKVYCADVFGIEAKTICVEADVSGGLPGFLIVGLPSSEVREAKERVLRAISNSGIELPARKITINLSPANMRKSGSGFDLPMAIAILGALGIVNCEKLDGTMVVGELSLDGHINPVKGVLSMAVQARNEGFKRMIVPEKNVYEGAAVHGIDIAGAVDLQSIVYQINHDDVVPSGCIDIDVLLEENLRECNMDFSDVKGQEVAKRATMVAVAGFHNLLYVGPPGSGKSMMAQRIPSILCPLTADECLEISKIYSVAGLLEEDSLMLSRPFRAPHHTITTQALIGGSINPKPGEITLAHKGVLFLDEAAEFKKETIETLRQPMETKKIIVNRMNMQATFPADFMLVMAMNPCKCGYYPDRNHCRCSEADVVRYFGKIRGPILDRIDVCVGTRKLESGELKPSAETMDSETMRERVKFAQNIQKERFKGRILFNSQMEREEIERFCALDDETQKVLDKAYKKFNMSARGYMKVLKVARTIADIDGVENINKRHVMEALNYRNAFVGR